MEVKSLCWVCEDSSWYLHGGNIGLGVVDEVVMDTPFWIRWQYCLIFKNVQGLSFVVARAD